MYVVTAASRATCTWYRLFLHSGRWHHSVVVAVAAALEEEGAVAMRWQVVHPRHFHTRVVAPVLRLESIACCSLVVLKIQQPASFSFEQVDDVDIVVEDLRTAVVEGGAAVVVDP